MKTQMRRVAAAILVEYPDANALLRFNRIYLREEVSVFFQVALRDPDTGQIDLSGVKIDAPHEKSLAAIIDEFEAHAKAVRDGTDPELEATRRAFLRVPNMLLGATFRVLDFLMFRLNLDLRWAGLPRDPYGAIMVTNVGSLGVEEAFAPIVPQSHVSIVVAVGEIHEAPLVKDGQVVVGEVMPLSATFDHRLLDGVHAANMVGLVKRWFADPFGHFDPIPGPAGGDPSAGDDAAQSLR